MTIVSLKINVNEDVERIAIEWKRGNKKSLIQSNFKLTEINN